MRAEPCVRVVFDQELLLAISAPSAVVLCRSRRPHHYCAYRQQLADGSLPCWWSGAGPAAVGMMSCLCLIMIREAKVSGGSLATSRVVG